MIRFGQHENESDDSKGRFLRALGAVGKILKFSHVDPQPIRFDVPPSAYPPGTLLNVLGTPKIDQQPRITFEAPILDRLARLEAAGIDTILGGPISYDTCAMFPSSIALKMLLHSPSLVPNTQLADRRYKHIWATMNVRLSLFRTTGWTICVISLLPARHSTG